MSDHGTYCTWIPVWTELWPVLFACQLVFACPVFTTLLLLLLTVPDINYARAVCAVFLQMMVLTPDFYLYHRHLLLCLSQIAAALTVGMIATTGVRVSAPARQLASLVQRCTSDVNIRSFLGSFVDAHPVHICAPQSCL